MVGISGKKYDQHETGNWSKTIATEIKQKLKGTRAVTALFTRGLFASLCEILVLVAEMPLPRYKYLVQVVIGEMRGAGIR